MARAAAAGRVAVLLSTYDGERYLAAQLDSLAAQSHPDWVLYWRDDGSSDGTRAVMDAFLSAAPAGRCVALRDADHLGSAGSFLRLLRAAHADGHALFAFADQDDVWLPAKLARGVAALSAVPEPVPALYCARQVLVDAELRRIALSAPLRRPPGFPAALTQNIATGCTVLLNRAAAERIAASAAPSDCQHDWWCYIVVTACGGRVLADDEAVVLYRQHGSNLVGAPATAWARGMAALRRGPGAFIGQLRGNLAALRAQPALLTEQAQDAVAMLARALDGGLPARWKALRMAGLRRQTWAETMLFRLWFLVG